MDRLALFALHKHFLAADAIKQLLFVQIPVDDKNSRLSVELQDVAQGFSAMLRLQVFYSLLYVVVEGYKELGCTDVSVNQLLTESSYVEGLRKFRNANFHYQEDPFSPKLVNFMNEKGSEIWVRNLYAALDTFFTSSLKLKDVLQSIEDATRDSSV